ncbi:MAG TPA: S41 family peptidase [Terriglobia bacterium]|nr:S41 family peptidase [Terriglobia bacterium]
MTRWLNDSIFFTSNRQSAILVALTLLCVAAVTLRRVASPSHAPLSPPAPWLAFSESLSQKNRLDLFARVWQIVNQDYYDPSFNGVDWKAVRERYQPRVEASTSDGEFYLILREMVGELHDAHTRFFSPGERERHRKREAVSAGAHVYEVEGKIVVAGVDPGSEAARDGVAAGMVVSTIDGKPAADRMAEVRAEVGSSSSERATALLAYGRLLMGEPDSILRLGLVREDGSSLEVALPRRLVSDTPKVEARLLPSGHGYIRFNRFIPPVASEIRQALEGFRSTRGLIIDLRGNGGGDLAETARVAGYFFARKTPIARIITRTGKPPAFFMGLAHVPNEFSAGRLGGEIYREPVALLVNEGTSSAAELFSAALLENSRATVVGRRTCGCVLGILHQRKLKGGGELDVSEVGFTTAQGRRLEGVGVIPDQSVPLTLADLRARRDAALEAAEKALRGVDGRR